MYSIGEHNVVIGPGAVSNAWRNGRTILMRMNATVLHNVEIGDFHHQLPAVSSKKNENRERSFVVGIPAAIKEENCQRTGMVEPERLKSMPTWPANNKPSRL